MRGEHADQEHRAVLKGLPRFPRPRDVSQRDRQRNQSHRVEAKRQPGKKSDPRGHPSPVGKDLRQRIVVIRPEESAAQRHQHHRSSKKQDRWTAFRYPPR